METILGFITLILESLQCFLKKLRRLWKDLDRITKKVVVLSFTAALVILICGVFFRTTLVSRSQEEEIIAEIDTFSPEEVEVMKQEDTLQKLLSEFKNFGIVETGGYINLRSEPDALNMGNIIGRLDDGAGVDIIEDQGEWLLVLSGGLKGYCLAEDILTGEEAQSKAADYICDRVVVTTEVLNIRSQPDAHSLDNIIGRAREGDRYVLVEIDGEWAKIKDATAFIGTNPNSDITTTEGYLNIGDGNAEIRKCLNAAKSLDLRAMATTQYDNMVLSVTDGYVNIREEPDESKGIANIIGKFAEGNGAELLNTVTAEDGSIWYEIRSGGISGYVSAKYCLTGESAKQRAVDYAKLTAYVNVDALNVRSDPSLDTDDNIWTSITKDQAYDVIDQLDGWVEIALDSGDDEEENQDRAFISTRDNNVIVRYGLEEAIEYYPAVEAANAAAAFRNSIVNFAVQYVGGRYVWGGTTLGVGVDCSGFVMRVFENFGINLPRVSRDQAKSGVKVTSDEMKPGDLVFYANRSGTINHVAIYIGNGQIISAASRRSGIKIYRWNYRTPVAIRNVIGA